MAEVPVVPALAVLLVAHPNPQTLSRALGVLGGGAGLLGLLPGLVGLIGLLGSVKAAGALLCLDRSHEGSRAETRCMASRVDGPAPQLLCVVRGVSGLWCAVVWWCVVWCRPVVHLKEGRERNRVPSVDVFNAGLVLGLGDPSLEK